MFADENGYVFLAAREIWPGGNEQKVSDNFTHELAQPSFPSPHGWQRSAIDYRPEVKIWLIRSGGSMFER